MGDFSYLPLDKFPTMYYICDMKFTKDNQPTHYRADHPRKIISVRVSEESYNKIKTKPKGWLGRWLDKKLKEE